MGSLELPRSSEEPAMRVVVATGNPGKAREFGRLLGGGFAVEPLPSGVRLPEETGTTFAENALLKARAVHSAMGGDAAVLADDSGVVAEALGDRPGIYSARYAGVGSTDGENTARLLADLEHASDRRARFVCALALVMPGGAVITAEGELPGTIAPGPRGSHGFGYDPVFVPEGWLVTLGEASSADKDAVSHRARAVEALRAAIAGSKGSGAR